jgi:biopolymer transport protein ExbD
MRKRGMPENHVAHPNVTPLIDIVMCLIIFFMLVAKIGVDTGADRQIRIPATIQGQEIKDMGNTLTLNVQEGPLEQPLITAMVRGEVRELKLVDPTNGVRQLLVELQRLRLGADMKEGTPDDNPDFKVILRGSEDMAYRFLEPVLRTCADAKVKNVNFNTRKMTEIAGVEP